MDKWGWRGPKKPRSIVDIESTRSPIEEANYWSFCFKHRPLMLLASCWTKFPENEALRWLLKHLSVSVLPSSFLTVEEHVGQSTLTWKISETNRHLRAARKQGSICHEQMSQFNFIDESQLGLTESFRKKTLGELGKWEGKSFKRPQKLLCIIYLERKCAFRSICKFRL